MAFGVSWGPHICDCFGPISPHSGFDRKYCVRHKSNETNAYFYVVHSTKWQSVNFSKVLTKYQAWGGGGVKNLAVEYMHITRQLRKFELSINKVEE